MKTTNRIAMVLLAGVCILAGCGKSSKPQPSAVVAVMDMRKLQQAFPSPSAEVQGSLDKVRMGVRYRQFEIVLTELDKLGNDASLTESQKKAVNEKIEQVKQGISAAAKPSQ
jgi:hypothetical protein